MDYFYIWHEWSLSLVGVSRVKFFSESEILNFWQILKNFRPCPWKKKSTVLDGFFPYLAQMITSMRGCVAYNDLWPWPIFSRSFGLDLENRVRSVASTVLDGFFPYLVQMITSMKRCRMWWPLTLTYIFKVIQPWLWKLCPLCSVYSSGWILFIFGTNDHYHQRVCRMERFFRIWKFVFFPYLAQMNTSMRGSVAYNDLWPWPIFSRPFVPDLENRVRSVASTVLDGFFPYLVQMITSMRMCFACDDLWPWPISSRSLDLDFENRVHSVTFSVLDRLFPYLPLIITTIRGCVMC